jgi:hypothetical protein
MNTTPAKALPAADLFVVLEKAYRRRARKCTGCNFSLPFPTDARTTCDANWTVMPTTDCCPMCRMILEDLVAEHQAVYRLAA